MTQRVLLALTSHDDLGGLRKTGYYVPEAAHPYWALRHHGFNVDFVSVKGGEPPVDGYDADDAEQRSFLEDADVKRALADTPSAGQLEAKPYAAIIFVGGHGTMWDFPQAQDLVRLAREIYEAGGVVAAVCHGPAALVHLTLSDGSYLVAGKRVAAFTNDEEEAVGLTKIVPFLLQNALISRGARHVAAPNFEANVQVDGRLVTGQNPASARGVGEAVAVLLKELTRSQTRLQPEL